MKKVLERWPFFLFLFPVFFVFHGFVENWRFIRLTDCLPLMAAYCAGAAVLYFLFYAFLRNTIKAAIVATFVMAFYLFFGYLHDFLRLHSIFLHRYSILFPSFFGLTLLLVFYLRKKAPFTRLSLFLTVLFLSYIPVDGVTWAWDAAGKSLQGPAVSPILAGSNGKCDSCFKPDIYLLLFDEYSGSRALREVYNYDNSALDSFLIAQGFHIQWNSRSNYCLTQFSMASMLNGAYLTEIPHPYALVPDDYTNIFDPIRKSAVVNHLISQGYSIINNSPFDLPEHPAVIDQPFIAVKTKLITYRTLTDYIVRDLGGWLDSHLTPTRLYLETKASQVVRMNQTFLAATQAESSRRSTTPRFVYMHVLMPHAPFMYDSHFHLRIPEEAITGVPKPEDYLGYLPYTNARIRQLISSIKSNTDGKAVILFMSDHGFRYPPDSITHPYFFKNQNGVYFPDGDYSLLYDSISNVNQFRVVFNKLFHLNLPLLADSSIFLLDSNWIKNKHQL